MQPLNLLTTRWTSSALLLLTICLLMAAFSSAGIAHRHQKHHQRRGAVQHPAEEDFEYADSINIPGIAVDRVPIPSSSRKRAASSASASASDSWEVPKPKKKTRCEEIYEAGQRHGIAIDCVEKQLSKEKLEEDSDNNKTAKVPKHRLSKFHDSDDARRWYEAIFAQKRK